MEKLDISEQSELDNVVTHALQNVLKRKIENTAAVLALSGDLGAGKTAFVKALSHTFGITDEVTSPTFVIMKRYEIPESENAQSFSTLVHIDAYRIEDVDEMRVLRFEEILAEKETIICIEWAENIQQLLPEHTVYMDIEITGENTRSITFR